MFVNRETELAALQRWWDDADARLALVWGRRRVGKTALLQRFAADRRVVFHTGAARPRDMELRLVGDQIAAATASTTSHVPPRDWDDALDRLAAAAGDAPVLLILDEMPELATTSPELAGVLRARLDIADARLKIILAGSAVRSMEALQDTREPLYGRVDLNLQIHPFRPHEAALMLPGMEPDDLALVHALVGGVPMYLQWWDADAPLRDNLGRLVTTSGGRLLVEGQLVLATETERGDLPERVLRAIAAGRTRHNEIADAIRADPTRTLERLIELRLVERLTPVTDDPRRTRRRVYRIADDLLAFWLGVVDRHRSEIERGLGDSILDVLMSQLDDHAGPRWEAAVRDHLRRLAADGELGPEIVAVGPWWRDSPETAEIDALVLAGRDRHPVLAVEAKWTTNLDVPRALGQLRRAVGSLDGEPHLALAARGTFATPDDVRTITAAQVFGRS